MVKKLETLLKQRSVAEAKLDRVLAKISKTVKDVTFDKTDADTCLERLNDAFSGYCEIQDEIMTQDSIDFDSESDRYGLVEDQYDNAKKRLASTLARKDTKSTEITAAGNSVSSSAGGASIKLPKLDLPTFNGKYSEWFSFMDLFNAAVHSSTSLTDAQKLQYLKTSLKDEPYRLISSLTITNSNYAVALETLTKRFENKKLIVHEHVHALVSFTPLKNESASALRKLIETTEKNLSCLKNLGIDTSQWDPMIVYLVSERLDPSTRKDWELESGNDLPTYDDLQAFIAKRASALEATSSKPQKLSPKTQVGHVASSESCPFCKGPHKIYSCMKFIGSPVNQRKQFVKENKLCYNCLSTKHGSRNCSSESTCRHCKKKHHSLIHEPETTANDVPAFQPQSQSLQTRRANNQALLATALVPVRNAKRGVTMCRALLDSGSESSFISESCLRRLGLNCTKHSVTVQGVGGKNCTNSKGSVEIVFGDSDISATCLVLSKLTNPLPSMPFPIESWSFLENVQLADPYFNAPRSIDLLLGVDVYDSIVMEKKMQHDTIFLRETIFGWIISGYVSEGTFNPVVRTLHATKGHDDFDLRKFWEIENIPKLTVRTPDEIACEQHFVATTKRLPDGRFEVQLPFKDPIAPDLDFTLPMATRRFMLIENRLSKNMKLKADYTAFIKEFIDLGHLELVPSDEVHKPTGNFAYLPHHAVFKESSTTTKVRVVFDGSAQRDKISLNNSLLVGPKIQDDIFDILLRFRTHKVALSADVAKMYRQIALAKPHQDFHRILWRWNTSSPIQHYRMTRVTYGIASSSFHSIRALQQSSDTNYDELASPVIKRDFYVDDLVTGAATDSDAIELLQRVSSCLEKSCFELRKWASNSSAVLDSIPPDLRETDKQNFSTSSIKELGVQWFPSEDVFAFEPFEFASKLCTKRTLLSDTSRIFDPLGFLAPLVIKLKCLFQHCWTLKLDWDDELPDSLRDAWQTYRSSFRSLLSLKIPRHVFPEVVGTTELHIFCDASESAYACVAYLVSKSDSFTSKMLCAKTRVAPTKTLSLPRLELCAALLGSNLCSSITLALQSVAKIDATFAWSDSTVALCWIKNTPKRWSNFVANRVSKIQDEIPPDCWNHVPSAQNPADVASRGQNAHDLSKNDLWWNGPDFLCNRDNWPIPVEKLTDLEVRKTQVFNASATFQPPIEFARFSQLNRLQRAFAYVLRFVDNTRQPREKRNVGPLTADDLRSSMIHLAKIAQKLDFPGEIDDINRSQQPNSKSPLLKLSPYLDANGLIVVGGRLNNSECDTFKKHPIVLSKSSQLSLLIVRNAHIETLHGSMDLTLSHVRERFWILSCRNLVRKVIHSCKPCIRFARPKRPPIMGDLPQERITPSKPFSNVGVDFAGPFAIKRAPRGNKIEKSYLSLFVCFATKALHLELVSSLSTASFLACLRRFIARRGVPHNILSDNGTNFVGASHELSKLLETARTSEVTDFLANVNCTWNFNPPSAPHFGGLWEAGVKTVKTHLRKIVGKTPLTFEELATTLAQIEACLNSRPLCLLSMDANDPKALTAGHFLVGDSLLALPDPVMDVHIKPVKRWELVQTLVNAFWRRWRSDYLNTLQPKVKWFRKGSDALRVNDVVLVTDAVSPAQWPLARIVKLHEGNDGTVRVATLFKNGKVFQRPVVKVRKLPTEC